MQPTKKSNTTEKNQNQSSASPIFLLAGEHSGDLLGSELMRELERVDPGHSYFGVGGERMIQEGLESMEKMEELSIIGFTAILFKYRFLKRLIERIKKEVYQRECKLAILIDYPGFNLRLAKELQQMGVKVIFYVSPQIWAWKFNRIHFIKENIDLMLTILPFETQIYEKYKVESRFVGHPIAQRIRAKLSKEENIPAPPANTLTVTIMPGSRSSEIRRLLEDLLEAAVLIQKGLENRKKVRFLLPNINKKEEAFIHSNIQKFSKANPDISIQYFFDRSLRAIEASDAVVVASGTATLEVAHFLKPMVICYKVSFLTYAIAARVLRSPYIGLVNVLGGKEVCRELLQAECTPENIAEEILEILEKPKYRKEMVKNLQQIRDALGTTQTAKQAARAILDWGRRILPSVFGA